MPPDMGAVPFDAVSPRPRRWRWRWWLPLGLVLLTAFWFKLPALGFYWVATRWPTAQPREPSLGLRDFRVDIEGLAVQGLSRNASGLTFNTDTGTLFTVINRPPQVAELSTDGRLLRLIDIQGLRDPEGITFVEGDRYVITDEYSHAMYWVRIGPGTAPLSVAGQPRLRLSLDVIRNASFEGVSWDAVNQRLYVVREKLPLRVLVIEGLDPVPGGPAPLDVSISEWKSWTSASLFMRDLSSLTLHEPSGHLLLLSDESAMVVEYGNHGEPLDILPLWRGLHGLQRQVPQPEGLAVGPDGALYVLSEPNLFYRFRPGPSANVPLTGQ